MDHTSRSVVWNPVARTFEARDEPVAAPEGMDLLVAVRVCALNPVDAKVMSRMPPGAPPRRLGFDACGEVVAIGPEAQGFAPGDRVWYAGAADRPGSFGTAQLVDSRIAAHAPATLDDADAAAMPLTTLTAWEALFERLHLTALSEDAQPERLLVINGAGGVGSIMLQLAACSGIAATATASRKESRDWCLARGAAEVVDHAALTGIEDDTFDRIFCAHDTDAYFDTMARLVAPQGMIVSVVGTQQAHDLFPLFQKSASFGWEYMFTRPVMRTTDMARQGEILARVAQLFDAGRLTSTRTVTLEGLSPKTVQEALDRQNSGRQIGKIVIRL